MDIAEFLAARLDEDERVAQLAKSNAPWRMRTHEADYPMIYGADDEVVVYDEGWPSEDEARHMVRFHPPRVLADVAAKRAILREYDGVRDEIDYDGGGAETRDALEDVLEQLVQPYADHPDFDPAWALSSEVTTPR